MACKNQCSSCCGGAWARRGCGCRSSSCNDARVGALRSVTGPFSNCANWGNTSADFPFYTGPCGWAQCCGEECCPPPYPPFPPAPPRPIINCAQASANFSAGAPVALSAGNTVALNRTSNPNEAFSATSEGIRVFCPGMYMVVYTVNVPEDTAVSSGFALSLNGVRVPASSINVVTANAATTESYTMHVLVAINSGDLLALQALGDVNITASPGSSVFTLSIVKIS